METTTTARTETSPPKNMSAPDLGSAQIPATNEEEETLAQVANDRGNIHPHRGQHASIEMMPLRGHMTRSTVPSASEPQPPPYNFPQSHYGFEGPIYHHHQGFSHHRQRRFSQHMAQYIPSNIYQCGTLFLLAAFTFAILWSSVYFTVLTQDETTLNNTLVKMLPDLVQNLLPLAAEAFGHVALSNSRRGSLAANPADPSESLEALRLRRHDGRGSQDH